MGEIESITNWVVGTPSHHHPLENAYLSETYNHCKNFAETFLKTSRTVWVITWWVAESWCLRLHKVRCWFTQLEMETLSETIKTWIRGFQQAGAVFARKLIWLPALHETETATSRRGELRRITVNMELRWRHYTSTIWTVFENIMHTLVKYFHYPIYPVSIW